MPEVKFNFRKWFRGTPKLTVVISNFNYSQFISSCLDSVKNQTLEQMDIIVVDDHSTDNSLDILRDWFSKNKKRFNRAMVLSRTSNGGPVLARNDAILQVRTEYTFILDADNLILPECLQILSESLANSKATFAFPISSKFGLDDGCVSIHPWNIKKLQKGNYIDMLSLIRTDQLKAAGMFSQNGCTKYGWEDYDLWIKFAMKGYKGLLVPEILARYRVHKNSRTFKTQNPNSTLMLQALKKEYPEFWKLD